MIEFTCPHCGKTLHVKPEAAGQKGKCPGCEQIVHVPGQAEKAPADPPSSDKKEGSSIRISCRNCSTRLKLPESAAGKNVKCPKCNERFQAPEAAVSQAPSPTVPQPQSPPPAAPTPSPSPVTEPAPSSSATTSESERSGLAARALESLSGAAGKAKDWADKTATRVANSDVQSTGQPARSDVVQTPASGSGLRVVCLVWGILAAVGMLVAFIPCLGWLNWLNIPSAIGGLILSVIVLRKTPEGARHFPIAGTVCCAVAVCLGFVRLVAGRGVV